MMFSFKKGFFFFFILSFVLFVFYFFTKNLSNNSFSFFSIFNTNDKLQPDIEIQSRILGLKISNSNNYKNQYWNKKFNIYDIKTHYIVEILSANEIVLDLGNTLNNLSIPTSLVSFDDFDRKSVFYAIGIPEKDEINSVIKLSVYLSEEYLSDDSKKFSYKELLINQLIYKAILISSKGGDINNILLTEKVNDIFAEMDKKMFLLPFKVILSETSLSRNLDKIINQINRLFLFKIVGEVYAGCCNLGSMVDIYKCTQSGAICSSSQNGTSCGTGNGYCVFSNSDCQDVSNNDANSCNVGQACCVGGCTCGSYEPPPACNPNCNCAADICVGEFCRNSCDTADCPGKKIDESLTNCTGTQIQYTETPQTTGKILAKAIGCTSGVTSVTFPTWNTYAPVGTTAYQDDIVWYSGENQGSGTWQGTIDISSHQPALGSTINVNVYENGICRPVDSGWKWVGAQTVTLAPKTCVVTINTSGSVSSQASGINVTATGNAHINPGSDWVRVWITRDDMGVIPGGVTYDYGGNNGLIAAEYDFTGKYYSLSNAYQNSINAANTSATFTVHAPPGNYRVHCDLPNDLNGNLDLVKCSGDPACSFNFNGGSKNCASSGWKSCSGNDWASFEIVSPPTLNLSPTNYLVLKNSIDTVVPYDIGSSNHICQTVFTEINSPPATRRQIKLVVTATDADGGGDIASVAVRLDHLTTVNSVTPATGNWSLVSPVTSSVSGNNKIYTFHMSLGNALDSSTLYNLEASATDILGATTGWIDSGRDLKVWDCQVPTSGTLYDGSAGQSCLTGMGFSVPIDGAVGFNSITFSDTPNVDMTASQPATYGSPDNITWGKTYHPRINGEISSNEDGDLLATGRVTRITDRGAGTAAQCPNSEFIIGSGPNALISAYSASPQAQIDFSFIQDQEAWYQVEGAGVKSAGPLSYGVPVTVPVASRFLTLGNSTVYNGLVSATSFKNNNGNNNKDDLGGPGLPQPYKNWYVVGNTNDLDIYNYNYFYNNFFVKAGVGSTGTDWDSKPPNGIYFVKKDLNIDSDFVLDDPLNTKTMMVIVNGNINIDKGVKNLDGIYIANGSISAGGISDDQLVINGMLYARRNVTLNRSFAIKTTNNDTPAVKVNYSPGLIFNLDPKVLQVLSGWREE